MVDVSAARGTDGRLYLRSGEHRSQQGGAGHHQPHRQRPRAHPHRAGDRHPQHVRQAETIRPAPFAARMQRRPLAFGCAGKSVASSPSTRDADAAVLPLFGERTRARRRAFARSPVGAGRSACGRCRCGGAAQALDLPATRSRPTVDICSRLLPERLLHNFYAERGPADQGDDLRRVGSARHRRTFARPLSLGLLADLRADRRCGGARAPSPHRREMARFQAGARRRLCRRHHRRARRQVVDGKIVFEEIRTRRHPHRRLRHQRRLGAALHLAQGPCRTDRRGAAGAT